MVETANNFFLQYTEFTVLLNCYLQIVINELLFLTEPEKFNVSGIEKQAGNAVSVISMYILGVALPTVAGWLSVFMLFSIATIATDYFGTR